MLRRLLSRVPLVLAAAAVALASVPAGAAEGPGGDGSFGYDDRNVWAGYQERPAEVAAAVVGRPRTPTRFCVRLPLPGTEAPPTSGGPLTPAGMRALARVTPLDRSPGAWHSLICYEIDAELPYLATFAEWNPADPTAGQTTTVEVVAEYARRLIDTPAPVVVTSPPPARQITGLEAWFATGAASPGPRTAQAGPLWATAEAVVRRVVVDPGDGTPPIVCDLAASAASPIVPVTAPECLRHTFTEVDARTGTIERVVRAHVVYDVYLTTSDDPVRRLVDTLEGDETAIPVTVREIQTVLR